MVDSIINYLDKFAPELLVIQFGFLVIVTTLFLWLWFSNRRKYHNLKHAIPANVVKNYLDSIIQNSTSLKSQLFRGGGLDISSSVPSVLSLQGLSGGENLGLSGAPSTALLEELNQKKALIASLESQLNSAKSAQRDFEDQVSDLKSRLAAAEARIKELEAQLAKARTAGPGADQGLMNELNSISRERDELLNRLKEFEIIADDLANLKRLQQENEQLKKSLASKGESLPSAPATVKTEVATEVSDLFEDLKASSGGSGENKALEEFLSEPNVPTEDNFEAAAAAMMEESEPAAPDESQKPKSDKTPEDLLSEFEKMLG